MLPFAATQEINYCGLLCLLLFAYDKSLQKVWVPLRKCPLNTAHSEAPCTAE